MRAPKSTHTHAHTHALTQHARHTQYTRAHAQIDTLTDPAGSVRLFKEAASADKSLRLFPGRWHVLLREPGADGVVAEVLSWLAARLP